MGYATSSYDGGWDTDDEPESERLAREAREAVLREAAAAASQKFRDTNPFSDGVTTGTDGGSGPVNLDPFNVIGVRETPQEREWREWRERTIAEAGGQNPVTTLSPFDPTRESAAGHHGDSAPPVPECSESSVASASQPLG